MGAGEPRLTAETGETLQRSGAGLLLAVLLTHPDGFGRFGDQGFQESVWLEAVTIAPGLIADERKDGPLELLLSELGQFNLCVFGADCHSAIGAEVKVSACAVEAVSGIKIHGSCLSRCGGRLGLKPSPLA